MINPGQPFLAYDCANEYINVTRISTLAVNECDFKKHHPVVVTEKIQLLQLAEQSTTHVYQCKYEVHRTILHCGMFNHTSMVRKTAFNFIKELSREECLNIHRFGTHKMSKGGLVTNIKANGTTYFGEAVAGIVDGVPNCEGEYFSDGSSIWHNVKVYYSLHFC